jgi:hypothetical protein
MRLIVNSGETMTCSPFASVFTYSDWSLYWSRTVGRMFGLNIPAPLKFVLEYQDGQLTSADGEHEEADQERCLTLPLLKHSRKCPEYLNDMGNAANEHTDHDGPIPSNLHVSDPCTQYRHRVGEELEGQGEGVCELESAIQCAGRLFAPLPWGARPIAA